MSRLKPSEELRLAGIVVHGEEPRHRTGGWRTGVHPAVDEAACVDCLLCWLYCPDSAIVLEGTSFAGFDLDVCKGCEVCSVVCPTGAIEMVPE